MELNLFSFQPTNSPLTKINPGIKLALLFIGFIILFYLEVIPLAILFFFLLFISLPLGFSLKNQFYDFLPILTYILMYYVISVINKFFHIKSFTWHLFLPSVTITLSILRLVVGLQLARFFYKTTTSIQLKSTLEKIELSVRSFFQKIPVLGNKVHSEASFTFIFTLVISFIPRLMSLWNQLNLSWKARGGTTSLKMIATLLPQLFILAFCEAANTFQAILSRELD